MNALMRQVGHDGTRDLESQLGTYINKLVWRIYIERTLKTSEKSLKQEQ